MCNAHPRRHVPLSRCETVPPGARWCPLHRSVGTFLVFAKDPGKDSTDNRREFLQMHLSNLIDQMNYLIIFFLRNFSPSKLLPVLFGLNFHLQQAHVFVPLLL